MTPQELKNSILQLAIQGKLVEQRPEEGTAAELLEKILATKNAKSAKKDLTRSRGARGAGEGMRGLSHLPKAALTLHGTHSATSASPREKIPDDEKPFDIPESWEWVRLESIINSIPSKQYQILESEVKPSGVFSVISQSKEYSIGFTDKSEKVYHHVNPVIVFGDHTAEVKFVEFDFVVGADGVKIFEPLDGIVIAKFLFYVLQFHSSDLSKVGGYSRHYKFLKDKPIPLPPLAEQKRIVAKIEELLPLIDRYEKAWSKLEDFNKRFPVDMQKSLLQMAIQGKLVEQRPEEGTAAELLEKIARHGTHKTAGTHGTKSRAAHRASFVSSVSSVSDVPVVSPIPDEEKPFDIPESWEWVRLSDLMTTISTGPFGSMLHKADYIENGIPLVNPANIVGGRIIPSQKMMVSEETRERLAGYILHEGMIVMGRRGEMGRCAVVSREEDGWLCGTGSFFLEPDKNIFVEYISRLFSTPYAKLYLGGESVGTTMRNLNHTILRNMLIPLPPLAEQKRIVAKLEEIQPLCERLKFVDSMIKPLV